MIFFLKAIQITSHLYTTYILQIKIIDIIEKLSFKLSKLISLILMI